MFVVPYSVPLSVLRGAVQRAADRDQVGPRIVTIPARERMDHVLGTGFADAEDGTVPVAAGFRRSVEHPVHIDQTGSRIRAVDSTFEAVRDRFRSRRGYRVNRSEAVRSAVAGRAVELPANVQQSAVRVRAIRCPAFEFVQDVARTGRIDIEDRAGAVRAAFIGRAVEFVAYGDERCQRVSSVRSAGEAVQHVLGARWGHDEHASVAVDAAEVRGAIEEPVEGHEPALGVRSVGAALEVVQRV